MPPLTSDDEITGSEPIINYSDVQARIPLLKPFHVEDIRVPETAIMDPTMAAFASREEAVGYRMEQDAETRAQLEIVEWDDESAELDALRQLEAELAPLNRASSRASAINADHMKEFVEEELQDAYGQEVIEALWDYLKWDDIQAARVGDMTETTYRGGTFYLTP